MSEVTNENIETNETTSLDEQKKYFESIKEKHEKIQSEYDEMAKNYYESFYLVGENDDQQGLHLANHLKDFMAKYEWSYYEALWTVNVVNDLNDAIEIMRNRINDKTESEEKGLRVRARVIETLQQCFSKHKGVGVSTAKSFVKILEPIIKAIEVLSPLATNLKLKENVLKGIKEEYETMKESIEQGISIDGFNIEQEDTNKVENGQES